VTGGAGFIGSHLVDSLVQDGAVVRVLDDLSTGREENLAAHRPSLQLVRGSITSPSDVLRACEGVEVIYHLAALPSVQKSVEDPLASHEICATGTLRLLDAARRQGVRRVVYAASSSAYGDVAKPVQREDDPLRPLSPYAAAKLAGEHYCECFFKSYGLETVRLRFFNIFGPRQDARSPYSGVIALFVAALAEGRRPIIYGDGLQTRDFVYVSNAVQALRQAATVPGVAGQVYNIGTGTRQDLLHLVATLNRLMGTDLQPEHRAPRVGDIRHSQADITRARQDLGYDPQVDLTEGLRRMLEAATPN
jgi:UDP-glucose 4-epimerase